MSTTIEALAQRCVRCGFCLDACPTYRLTGNEADSPRGRLHLMGSTPPGATPARDIVAHIDRCLGCRACETACPSGVEYGRIVEHFRARIEASGVRGATSRAARRSLLDGLTDPTRFSLMLRGRSLLRLLGQDAGTVPSVLADHLAGSGSGPVVLPSIGGEAEPIVLPTWSPPIGQSRGTACIIQGCVMRVLYQRVNLLTIELLTRNGYGVVCPPGVGCCGALDLHAGRVEAGLERARGLLEALDGVDFDFLVMNSAGCGSTLKEYGLLLAPDARWATRARVLSQKVQDISELFVRHGWQPPCGELRWTVAYHDACHLAHAQRITSEPRRLLQSVPGLTVVPLTESDMCCGSAGTYNLTQPDLARQLLERKVANIAATGAEAVVMGNPGCLAWISRGLADAAVPCRAVHLVEVLAEAYRRQDAPAHPT